MSYLEELIQTLCPDGVEFVCLGDIADIASSGVDKKTVEGQKNVLLLNYMDVYRNKYIDRSILSMEVTASDSKITSCDIQQGDIFITPTSETIEDLANSAVATESIGGAVYSYHVMRIRLKNLSITTSFFLNYLFRSKFLQEQILQNASGLTRFGLSRAAWRSLLIPIPPLPVQEEIVRILDTYSDMVADLEQNLEAELAARVRQYEYYRDLLFKPNGHFEQKTLGDVGRVCMCRRIYKEQTNSFGEVPFYKIGTFGKTPDAFISKDLFDEFKSKYSYPRKGEILFSAAGTIGRTVIFDGSPAYFQDSNIVWIENDETLVLNKYLYYFYSLGNWATSEGGTIARLYNDNISKTPILVPSLKEQEKIVSILDHFDSLVNNLKSGLPAEIALRRKQYEYYRDKLLTFKEKPA